MIQGREIILRQINNSWKLSGISFLAACSLVITCGLVKAQEKGKLEFVTSKSTGMKLVKVPGGTFKMGAGEADEKYLSANAPGFPSGMLNTFKPVQEVTVKPFYMGIYEVTQKDYKKINGKNPVVGALGIGEVEVLDAPVFNVSWFDALDFCNKLSTKDGLTPCYALKKTKKDSGAIVSAEVTVLKGTGYRLPTEQEWEYACRAGTTTPFAFGNQLDAKDAKFKVPNEKRTPEQIFQSQVMKVGSYRANNFGLYDMHGNVSEFCFDIYKNAYVDGETQIGFSLDDSQFESRVLRGGSFDHGVEHAMSCYRQAIAPSVPWEGMGFRVVRN